MSKNLATVTLLPYNRVMDSGSVLGVNTFGPVEGSPLLPPEILTVYFLAFLFFLSLVYFFIYRRKRPVTLWHHIKLLTLSAIIIKIVFILGVGVLAFYWLFPTPQVTKTTPSFASNNFPTTNKIEILFDRPLDRSELVKSITPEVPGRWVFENSLYTTHLYRKLVFYPTFSLKPNTKYTVNIAEITSLTKQSTPYNYNFDFTTQASPDVLSITPTSEAKDIEIDSEIKVNLTAPNPGTSEFIFEFIPPVEYQTNLDLDKKVYSLKPKALKQGTKYSLTIKKTDLILNLQEATIFERSQTSSVYESSFTTTESPGISSFKPQSSTNISLNPTFQIIFSQAMNQESVEENFSIEPKRAGTFNWINEKTLEFTPLLEYEKNYVIKIAKGTKTTGAGYFEEDVIKSFSTIGSPKILSITPSNDWQAVNINTPVKITFDQAVDKQAAQSKFKISPEVEGSFSWQDNTLIFTPTRPLAFTTNYIISIEPGLRGSYGLNSKEQFISNFTTSDETTKLAVPAYLQKYSLSCEIASLRMALAFKGVHLDEDTIHREVGQDPTAHQGDIWGNPHGAFVGNINGRQMSDGYGVHWEPIAKAANLHRSATAFQGWSIAQLTEALSAGNPVVIWVYSSGGWPTTWKTPDGLTINAARDEHAVTAVGFVGSPANPSQLIINDPLVGQVYWNRAVFDKKWAMFGRAGVVVN
jgi:uncharacterized protein YvpB